MCQVSHVTCHVSFATYHHHLSHVTCHMSLMPTATVTDPPPANSPTMHCKPINELQRPKNMLFCETNFYHFRKNLANSDSTFYKFLIKKRWCKNNCNFWTNHENLQKILIKWIFFSLNTETLSVWAQSMINREGTHTQTDRQTDITTARLNRIGRGLIQWKT